MSGSAAPGDHDLVEYYAARAAEYEKVYARPERQADLGRLHTIIPEFFAGRRLLEVACGTGYWTRRIAPRAAALLACDLTPEVLEVARASQAPGERVTFRQADAYALAAVGGDFDGAFAGFWWSHIPLDGIARFLGGLHERLVPESHVMFVDNRYVEGSSHPITRVAPDGNSYQARQLDNGTPHEVLKNFPSPAAVTAAITAAGGEDVAVFELPYYWYATYRTASASPASAHAG